MNSLWPSMRQNPHNTGTALHGSKARQSTSASILSTGGLLFSTPVIDEHERIYIGSSDHTFYAYDPEQKKVVWQIATKEVIDSAGAIHPNGTILFPSGDGNIYCCDTNGTILWKFDVTKNRPRDRFSFATSYWWEGNIAIDPEGYIYAGNDDFFLYCLTPNGDVRWALRTDLFIWASVVFGEPNMLYASSFDGSVYAVERSTGKVLWKRDTKNPLISSPAIWNDTLFQCTLGGTLLALHRTTGAIQWSAATPPHVYASPLITPDGIVITTSSSGDIQACTAEDGSHAWSWKEFSVLRSSPVCGIDPEEKSPYLIYGGNGNGELFALDAQGSLRWRLTSAPDGINSEQHVINGSLALGATGIAAPIGKYLTYVPYTYYQTHSSLPFTAEHQSPAYPPDALQAAEHLVLNNIHITAPTIIPTLDQIGLQSLQLSLVLVAQDEDTGTFLAYGNLIFGHNEDGELVGVPRSQTYSFAFEGHTTPEGVELTTRNIFFETSGFPFPLDVLEIATKQSSSEMNATITAKVIRRGPLYTFGSIILAHISANPPQSILKSVTSIADIPVITYAWFRLMRISLIFFIRKYWSDWDLFDDHGSITIAGMASLIPTNSTDKQPQWKVNSHTYNQSTGVFTAQCAPLTKDANSDALAVIIGNSDTLKPLPINYSRDIMRKTDANHHVRITLSIPESLRKDIHLSAYILDNTTLLDTIECQ